jgi:hypothetical protein
MLRSEEIAPAADRQQAMSFDHVVVCELRRAPGDPVGASYRAASAIPTA